MSCIIHTVGQLRAGSYAHKDTQTRTRAHITTRIAKKNKKKPARREGTVEARGVVGPPLFLPRAFSVLVLFFSGFVPFLPSSLFFFFLQREGVRNREPSVWLSVCPSVRPFAYLVPHLSRGSGYSTVHGLCVYKLYLWVLCFCPFFLGGKWPSISTFFQIIFCRLGV